MLKSGLGKIMTGIFIASLIISALTGYLYWSGQKTNVRLTADLDRLGQKLEEEQTKSSLKQESSIIDTDALVEIPAKIEKIYIQKEVRDASVDKELLAINEKYSALEKSQANKEARSTEVSTARINNLWVSYCSAITGDENCPPKATDKEQQ